MGEFAHQTWGQEMKNEIGSIIEFKAPAKHSRTNTFIDSIYIKEGRIANYLNDNIKFKVMGYNEDEGTINLVSLPFIPAEEGKLTRDLSEYLNYKIFEVNDAEFLAKAKLAEETPDRFSIGILTLPFKFRLQNEKSFETNFNLNSTLNLRLRKIYSIDFYFQAGAGIGGVSLNSTNARGIGLEEEIDAASLTLLSGFMLQYKNAQAGIYFGFDHINNQSHYQWKHNGDIWLGFGVSYQLFNIGLSNNENVKQN